MKTLIKNFIFLLSITASFIGGIYYGYQKGVDHEGLMGVLNQAIHTTHYSPDNFQFYLNSSKEAHSHLESEMLESLFKYHPSSPNRDISGSPAFQAYYEKIKQQK